MAKRAIPTGLYFFQNYAHSNGGATHTGSQLDVLWRQLQPTPGDLRWAVIDDWVSVEKQRGKKWVMRLLTYQNRGAYCVPEWAASPIILKDNSGRDIWIPDYASSQLVHNLIDTIHGLGARYDGDPDLAMVQIGLGLYGETHPERDDAQGALASTLYNSGRLNPCAWIAYCKQIMAAYAAAFPSTPLVIMNAPAYPWPCRSPVPPYPQTWARRELDSYAMELGIGAQNNSLDEWDANWFTTETEGANGPYTIDGSVGPFVDKGMMYAGERGSWLAPFAKDFSPIGHQSWWSYLNGLSKGMRIIFPPQYSGAVRDGTKEISYPSGVWNYDGPHADALRWMNQFAIDSMAGRYLWWFAFDAPYNPPSYTYGTAQHCDHELGIHRLTEMASEQDALAARPPFFEDKHRRRLHGPVTFETTPGRYHVTVWYRGEVHVLGQDAESTAWTKRYFDADVPAQFTVSGEGYVHGIILEPVDQPPVDDDKPPPPPENQDDQEPERFEFTTKRGTHIVITVG